MIAAKNADQYQQRLANAGAYAGPMGQAAFAQNAAQAPLAHQIGRVNEGGYEYQLDPNTGRPLQRTSLQNTERYQGDNFLRGLDGVDQLGAYDAETRRTALAGLMGGFNNMVGGGTGGQGFNITGPGGPVASLNYNTSINPQQQVFNPQQGAAQMQATPQHYAGTPGANAFAHNQMGLGQANATQFQRTGAQNQNQYFNQAQTAQNQGALAGLGQGIRQRNNARGRQNQAFDMAGGMMQGLMR